MAKPELQPVPDAGNIELIYTSVPNFVVLRVGRYFFPATQCLASGAILLPNPIAFFTSQQQVMDYWQRLYTRGMQRQAKMIQLAPEGG